MAKKYILEREALQPADIILTADHSLTSKSVRLATKGKYSHAAIWCDGTLIEATLDGVYSKNPQRLLADSEEHLAVYRSKIPLSPSMADDICYYARSKVGSLYSITDAILISPKRLLDIKSSNGQFCSRLVAMAYHSVGYNLCNLRNPEFCTPNQLALCKAFTQVPNMLRLASVAEVKFANTEDPGRKLRIETYKWLNPTRDLINSSDLGLARNSIQTINDVYEVIYQHPELEQSVNSYRYDTEYLTFYPHDRTVNPYRYNEFMMLERGKRVEGGIVSLLQQEFNIVEQEALRYVHCAILLCEYYSAKPIRFFYDELKLYRNVLNEVLDWLTVIGHCAAFLSLPLIDPLRSIITLINQLIAVIDLKLR